MPEPKARNTFYFIADNGDKPFRKWYEGLTSKVIIDEVDRRLVGARLGNYGDFKRDGGVIEMRLHEGSGHRIYMAEVGKTLLLLLTGGPKSSQKADFANAKEYLKIFVEREKRRQQAKQQVQSKP